MSTAPRSARGLAIGGALVLSIATAAGPAAPADAKITCNSKSHGGGAWYQGKTASNVYDTRFSAGPAVPGLRNYVPQGIATWHNWDAAGHDLLVVSSYRDGGGTARLFGIDAATGKHVGTVAIAPTHAGGIAITNGWAFVQGKDSGSKHYVRKYELSQLRGAMKGKDTPYIKQIGKARQVYGSAFLSSYGDNLYAGRFNDKGRGRMYRYKVTGTGALKTQKGAYEVPTKTQGLLVTNNHFIYSTSLGNDNRSNIYVVAGGARDIDIASTKCFRAPSMAEGIAEDGGTAYLLYESGSRKYIQKAPRNVIPNLHKAKVADIVSF
jgi:hypothetical protein